MNALQTLIQANVGSGTLFRGKVLAVLEDGSIAIGHDEGTLICDFLQTDDQPPPHLAPDDNVLAWLPVTDWERGLIIGRVAAGTRPADDAGGPQPEGAPGAKVAEDLVIEATGSLTLRVGDGSITIRQDGRILIKGKDLVSSAQRMNRIKGGAVSIN